MPTSDFDADHIPLQHIHVYTAVNHISQQISKRNINIVDLIEETKTREREREIDLSTRILKK